LEEKINSAKNEPLMVKCLRDFEKKEKENKNFHIRLNRPYEK